MKGKKRIVVLLLAAVLTFLPAFGVPAFAGTGAAPAAQDELQARDVSPYLSRTRNTMYVGDAYRLKVYYVDGTPVYTSSDPKVAGVTTAGTIKAKKAGTCTIRVKVDGITLKCKVTVKDAKLSKTRLYTYNSRATKLTFYCGGTGTVKWKSSNPAVARVSSNGTVRGLKTGSCTITATRGKYSRTCLVKVSPNYYRYTMIPDFGAQFGIQTTDTEYDTNDEYQIETYPATKTQVSKYIANLKDNGFTYSNTYRKTKWYKDKDDFYAGVRFENGKAYITYMETSYND